MFKGIRERGTPCPQTTFLFPVHRQQPSGGQHGRQLWDPDDRVISRSPQLLSFIRGMWAREGQVGLAPRPTPTPGFLLQPPPHPGLLSSASTEAQRLLWESMEGYRLSRRGLDDGRDPFAALPVEAGMGGVAAIPAVQPGPRRNTRHRNKRQRGARPSGGSLEPEKGGVGSGLWRIHSPAWPLTFRGTLHGVFSLDLSFPI